jgi:hypothetical protein
MSAPYPFARRASLPTGVAAKRAVAPGRARWVHRVRWGLTREHGAPGRRGGVGGGVRPLAPLSTADWVRSSGDCAARCDEFDAHLLVPVVWSAGAAAGERR